MQDVSRPQPQAAAQQKKPYACPCVRTESILVPSFLTSTIDPCKSSDPPPNC